MLRACVIKQGKGWDKYLPLVEFAYNNNYHSSIKMVPYKSLYGTKCRSPLYCFEVGEKNLLGPDLVQQTTEQIRIIQDKMLTA